MRLGTCACLSMPSTATGSVGLISAPNSRHSTSGTDGPSAPSSVDVPRPTSAMDSAVLSSANASTGPRRAHRAWEFTPSAPANSRNDSTP